jgi:broad specificity phosphatase PhoE
MNVNFIKIATLLLCYLCFSLIGRAKEQTWYFVRHFEKMSGKNPGLSKQGMQRALKLAHYFTHTPLTRVFSSDYQRTKETSQAVAQAQGLKVKLYHPAQLADLAQQLKLISNVLVVGHSNTTPELITLMGGKATPIAESDYGQLFMVRSTHGKIETQVMDIAL